METARNGEDVQIIFREFVSSEDGELFISRLEGIPSQLLNELPPESRIVPSQLDHLLAVIQPDKKTTVYTNELPFIASTQAKGSIAAGTLVGEDDIVDIRSLSFDVELPPDAGILLIFSLGWRKGMFYDFGPLRKDNPQREFDINKVLGGHYAYVAQRNLFSLTDDEWSALIDQQWFLFATLKKATLRDMVQHVRNEDLIYPMLPQIRQEVLANLEEMRKRWEGHNAYDEHIKLLKHALEEYEKEDYISATAIIYPRLEGMMRTLLERGLEQLAPTQANLASAHVVASQERLHEASWLFPRNFERFLKEAYFANFDPSSRPKISRHSVSHGVAHQEDFDLKAATIGLLTLDQLYFFIPS
ncbi:MAG: hypothetical protein M1455_03835 [Actinobacteria bacterium]|nr:hypothetical protein [Actinomycetota bacterium]